MTEFRSIDGRNGLAAHQSGAFGTPTHWVITRNGAWLCDADSEVQARILLNALAPLDDFDWSSARDEALREMRHRRAA